MSGIAGIFNLDSRPVEGTDLWQMLSMLKRRGPDGSNVWCVGSIGLSQTMLVTTPEASHERLPHVSVQGDLVIVADARLDNRAELIVGLGLQDREQENIGDSELILGTYRKWGETCPDKLLGDFAFAVWDSRNQKLFCARDQFGVRPFYYYHDPGRIFVFASEPRAILVLKQIPYRINEARIADFLVTQLEGIDKTSTFFEEVYRLPPANIFAVTPDGIKQQQYWSLEPGSELKLGSDDAETDWSAQCSAAAWIPVQLSLWRGNCLQKWAWDRCRLFQQFRLSLKHLWKPGLSMLPLRWKDWIPIS
jgi:asparagine synthase (glutamine-hydrolysing)